jgi:hypothetical protein
MVLVSYSVGCVHSQCVLGIFLRRSCVLNGLCRWFLCIEWVLKVACVNCMRGVDDSCVCDSCLLIGL